MKSTIVGMGDLLQTSPALGNKVKNLAVLAGAGVRVPRGFGIPFDVYTATMKGLFPAMHRAREVSFSSADLAKRLHDIVVSAPFSQTDAVLEALDIHMPGAEYFAVRSSGAPVINGREAAEDSAALSLAGQYESYLLVPKENVPQAVLWCYASLFGERSLDRFKVLSDGSYLGSRMSVLVQEMFIADLCAVVMTRDPVEGGDHFGMELTYGACEALVSGMVQGDLYLLSRNSGALLSSELGSKTTRIDHEPLVSLAVDNKVVTPLSAEQRACYAASQELVAKIYRLGMHIERIFGSTQDIELVVSNGEIVVTQSRPITATR
jgi:phosphoenolpyruvate synthase/pyruvate phosphate dikinase